MYSKTVEIDLSGCDMFIIDDEIQSTGIGYCCIVKCPASQVGKLAEYAVSLLIAKGATEIMLGFKNTLHKPVRFKNFIGNLKIKHIHNMLSMKKKFDMKIKYKFDKDLKLKKVNKSTAKEYCTLYNRVFKDVPNAATYQIDDVLELLNKNNYDICFAYHKQTLVGFCEYQITTNDALIEAIGIDEPYRNKGFAKMLFNNLYYIFRAENVENISLTTSNINKKAVKLYKQEKFSFNDILSYWYKVIL